MKSVGTVLKTITMCGVLLIASHPFTSAASDEGVVALDNLCNAGGGMDHGSTEYQIETDFIGWSNSRSTAKAEESLACFLSDMNSRSDVYRWMKSKGFTFDNERALAPYEQVVGVPLGKVQTLTVFSWNTNASGIIFENNSAVRAIRWIWPYGINVSVVFVGDDEVVKVTVIKSYN